MKKQKVKSKFFNILSQVIKIAFFTFFILYIAINIFFPKKVITIFKRQSYVILTSSMVPANINPGDLVYIKIIDFDNLEKGDIISFYVDANDDGKIDVVTHFFDHVDNNGYYRTKSAVSNDLDGWYLDKDDIIGEYISHIPKIGRFILYLRSPIGLVTLAIDIIILFLLISIIFDESKDKLAIKNLEE